VIAKAAKTEISEIEITFANMYSWLRKGDTTIPSILPDPFQAE
jgi:hypothetical protein